jgi:hypothetical protein
VGLSCASGQTETGGGHFANSRLKPDHTRPGPSPARGQRLETAQVSGFATTQDEDGGVYEGTFQDGLQHGTGTYRLPNGYEYTGEWVAGKIEGRGIARFPERIGL